jgi:hypothetical protein
MCSSYKSQTTALNTIILQDIEANAKTQPLNALSLSLSLQICISCKSSKFNAKIFRTMDFNIMIVLDIVANIKTHPRFPDNNEVAQHILEQ